MTVDGYCVWMERGYQELPATDLDYVDRELSRKSEFILRARIEQTSEPARGVYRGAASSGLHTYTKVLEWVVLAMISGVAGNAAYDWLKKLARTAETAVGRVVPMTGSYPRRSTVIASIGAGVDRDEAISLARVTLREYCDRYPIGSLDPLTATVVCPISTNREDFWEVGFVYGRRTIVVLVSATEEQCEVRFVRADLSKGAEWRDEVQ